MTQGLLPLEVALGPASLCSCVALEDVTCVLNHESPPHLQGEAKPRIRNVFTLNTCASISGAQVISFPKEPDMLATWHQFLIECDADIVTGYNIVGFDLPYLLTRAETLKVEAFYFIQ